MRRRTPPSDRSPGTATLWLFDFDNTLAELRPCVDWAASRRELERELRKAGVPGALFEQHPVRNLPLYDAARAMLLVASDDDREAERRRVSGRARQIVVRASAIIEKHELAGVDRVQPLAGALELLQDLRASGATPGIVTSNSARTVTRWLRRNRVERQVAAIVGRDSLLALKPAPDMLLHALRQTGFAARDAVYVGDSDDDLRAAARARIRFVAIAGSSETRNEMLRAGADRIFASPAALAIYLNLVPARGQNQRINDRRIDQ